MFEALKRLLVKKRSYEGAKPGADAHRSPAATRTDDSAAGAPLFTTSPGDIDSFCDAGVSSSCDSGAGGGD